MRRREFIELIGGLATITALKPAFAEGPSKLIVWTSACAARGFFDPAGTVLHQCIRPLLRARCARTKRQGRGTRSGTGRLVPAAPEVTRRNTRIHFIQPLKARIVREVGYGLGDPISAE